VKGYGNINSYHKSLQHVESKSSDCAPVEPLVAEGSGVQLYAFPVRFASRKAESKAGGDGGSRGRMTRLYGENIRQV
jgi:hypothetical protein